MSQCFMRWTRDQAWDRFQKRLGIRHCRVTSPCVEMIDVGQTEARDAVVGPITVMLVTVEDSNAAEPPLREEHLRRDDQAVEGAVAATGVVSGMVEAGYRATATRPLTKASRAAPSMAPDVWRSDRATASERFPKRLSCSQSRIRSTICGSCAVLNCARVTGTGARTASGRSIRYQLSMTTAGFAALGEKLAESASVSSE